VRIQTDGPGDITIGVNKIHAEALSACVVDMPARVERTTGDVEITFPIFPERDWTYAVHGRSLNGLPLHGVNVIINEPDLILPEPDVIRRMVETLSSPAPPIEPVPPPMEPTRRGTGLIKLTNRMLRPTRLRLDRF